MSEVDGITSMARLEMEILKDGTMAAIDISKFGWHRLIDVKKFVLFLYSLKYSKTKGATNVKNLMQKTNGNVMTVQLPDECRKDFETFCKKNGILCAKMYDFNRADGNKQYIFDANMADLVYQVFAREISEKYGSQFSREAEDIKAQMQKTQEDIYRNEAKRKEYEDICRRMEEGQIENEIDSLAKAMGYYGSQDQEFKNYMQSKYEENGIKAYKKEAELQMEQWENRTDIKKRELKEQAAEYDRLEKKAKNPVRPISLEDYVNINNGSLKEFEENLQRMTADENCPVYENMNASEALRQDTPIPREKKEIWELRPEKQDYIYNSQNPDVVITRSYYKDVVDGQTVGCYHVLECEKDGKKYYLNDRGMGKNAYQEALGNFLEQAGMDQDSRVAVLSDRSELDQIVKIDKQVAEKPPIPNEVMNPDRGEEDNRVMDFVQEKQKKEQEQHLTEQSAKEYSEPVARYKLFQDPASPDRVRIPVTTEDGSSTWMVEMPKDSITSDGRGNMQVHFNGSDQMRAYEAGSLKKDGRVEDESAYQTITGREFHEALQRKGLNRLPDITIDRGLINAENDHAIKTRVPGMYNENVGYIWIDRDNIKVINDGKTILTTLDPRKDYKIYGEDNKVREVLNGRILYSHYDKVDKGTRERAEKEEVKKYAEGARKAGKAMRKGR